MWTDCLGNPVTLHDPGGLAALDDFVGGFVASEARAVNILAAAETDYSPLVQAYAAAVHMFAEARDAPANAQPYLQRALAGAAGTTPRERRFIAAIAAWVTGDVTRAISLHDEQAREFPRDLASLKLGPLPPVQPGRCGRHVAHGAGGRGRRCRRALLPWHAGLRLGAMP